MATTVMEISDSQGNEKGLTQSEKSRNFRTKSKIRESEQVVRT